MGIANFNLKNIVQKMSQDIDKVPITQGVLFTIPALAILLSSYALFSMLKGLTIQQLNMFSITVTSAVVLALVGTSAMQFLTYKIIADSKDSKEEAASRVIRLGIIHCVSFSTVAGALLYPYFQNVLGFPLIYFCYFAVLLFSYSMVWILTAVFWAMGQYKYPALFFTVSYLAVFAISYGFYLINPANIISGYTVGIAILALLLAIASRAAFREKISQRLSDDLSTIPKLVFRNYSTILFHAFYMLAIFLDKIIVWVSEGSMSGNGLMLVCPYTTGAFLGMVPMLSIAALAYFTIKVKPVIKDMYKGALLDIQRETRKYKYLYTRGLQAMLVIGAALFILVATFSIYFMNDLQLSKILVTTSLGALFFMVIVYNSAVLPIFGKANVSAVSMLVVCIGEALAIPFVATDVWYASIGFAAGSFIGFLISSFSTRQLFSKFEYNMFRPIAVATIE